MKLGVISDCFKKPMKDSIRMAGELSLDGIQMYAVSGDICPENLLGNEEKINDGELELMLALGFGDKLRTKYGDERVRVAEEKMRIQTDAKSFDGNTFGCRGKEYTQKSDIKKINSNFNKDRLFLMIQLIGTLFFATLLFLLENKNKFGIFTSGEKY